MADQPERPDDTPDAVPPAQPPAAKKAPAKKAPAKKAPAKKAAAKKTPAAKKAPVKKAPAAKKAPAQKTPAKKAAPAKKTPPAQPAPAIAKTNGDLSSAAKAAAEQAKSTVAGASDAVINPAIVQPDRDDAAVKPIAVALITGLLAVVVVLWVARRGGDD